MHSFRFSFFVSLFVASLFFTFHPSSWAYGPIAVDTNGTPLKHKNLSSSNPLRVNFETGPIQQGGAGGGGGGGGGASAGGCSLIRKAEAAISSNAEGINLMLQAMSTWSNPTNDPPADVSFAQGDSLGVDVDINNYTQFIDSKFDPIDCNSSSDTRICGCLGTCSAPCRSPVVFDANGDIVANEFGEANRTALLGSAGPTVCNLQDGFLRIEAIFNGVCLEDTADPSICGTFKETTQDLKTVMTHEFGHAQGLTHAQLNGNSVVVNGGTSATVKSGANPEDVPTMYPLLVQGSDQTTLHKDDMIGLAHLYPKNLNTNFCNATGKIFKTSTSTGLRCAEVIFREATNPTLGAVSVISGAEVRNDGNPSPTANSCAESVQTNCGNYTIQGLKPNTTYQVDINAIPAFMSGGSSITPCDPPPANVTPKTGALTINCGAAGITVNVSNIID
jgi:hypothetical protein